METIKRINQLTTLLSRVVDSQLVVKNYKTQNNGVCSSSNIPRVIFRLTDDSTKIAVEYYVGYLGGDGHTPSKFKRVARVYPYYEGDEPLTFDFPVENASSAFEELCRVLG